MGRRFTPKRVALWGYGRMGKAFFEEQRKHPSRHLDITTVFDSSVGDEEKTLIDSRIPLVDSKFLAKEYARGSFDGVLLTVGSAAAREEMSQHLERLHIPMVMPLSRDEFLGLEAFENATARKLAHGFELHEYEGIYGSFSPLYPGQVSLFLFDGQERLLVDNWFQDAFDWDPLLEQCFPRFNVDSSMRSLAGEYCVVARAFGANYWHFTYQHLDQIVLMEQEGFEGTYVIPRSPAAEQLIKLFGLGEERILWLDELEENCVYQFERVCIISQELYDFTRSAPLVFEAGRRIAEGVERLGKGKGRYPSRIFVKRIGSRKLLCDDKLFERHGFEVIIPDELSVAEQIRHFQNADIVLTPHGANSTNSLYMRPGSVFIETFGKQYALPLCTQTLMLGDVFYLPVIETPITSNISFSNVADYKIAHHILEGAIHTAVALVS